MVHLIVGYGEVGKGLGKVLGKHYWITRDERNFSLKENARFDVVHICIPYSKGFKKEVEYWKQYTDLIIVHSTVPLGTCDALGVVHSPIRGMHPNLAKGIKTFVKYFGGKGAFQAAKVFKDLGLQVRVLRNARNTEALKLWDTTQYGKLIKLEKKIHAWCEKNDVDFSEVYVDANQTYNEGYIKLGRPEVVRPWLRHMEGPIGGHCIVPNAKLLGEKL